MKGLRRLLTYDGDRHYEIVEEKSCPVS